MKIKKQYLGILTCVVIGLVFVYDNLNYSVKDDIKSFYGVVNESGNDWEKYDDNGNRLPTDDEMHEGALYDNNGDIVANEYELNERNREIKRRNNYNANVSNKKCSTCPKNQTFYVWKEDYVLNGEHHGRWEKVTDQKTGWVKCYYCNGYGVSYEGVLNPDFKECTHLHCENGWIKCKHLY